MSKLPQTPPTSFITEPRHLRAFGTSETLWRIYRTAGGHPVDWDQLRHWGPAATTRWDPQTPPPGVDPTAGVSYAAVNPVTAFGEVYQERRVIARSEGAPTLVAWHPSRELTLLDLTTNWPVKNTASAAMMMGPKRSTQVWARAIHLFYGDQIDGIYAHSSVDSQPVVTLFQNTETVPAFPKRPAFRVLLSDSASDVAVDFAADELGFKVLS